MLTEVPLLQGGRFTLKLISTKAMDEQGKSGLIE